MIRTNLKIKTAGKIALLHGRVPGPGIEPGWVTPTVFETVASTDSAIRAFCSRKVRLFAPILQIIFDGSRLYA